MRAGREEMIEKRAFAGVVFAVLASGSANAMELRGALDTAGNPAPTGWYLRGDFGVNTPGGGFSLAQDDTSANGGGFSDSSLSRTASIDLGIGYRFSPNFRVDGTLELRSGANLRGTGNVRILNARGQTAADIYGFYDGQVESQVALLNGYYDFATWRGITPFVGASIGVARNTVSGLAVSNDSTINVYSNVAPFDLTSSLNDHSTSSSSKKTTYSFAWGLSTGAAVAVNDRLSIEASYRYLNLGTTASSAMLNCSCGSTGEPLKLGTLDSHDIRLGMRWSLDDPAPRSEPIAARQPVRALY